MSDSPRITGALNSLARVNNVVLEEKSPTVVEIAKSKGKCILRGFTSNRKRPSKRKKKYVGLKGGLFLGQIMRAGPSFSKKLCPRKYHVFSSKSVCATSKDSIHGSSPLLANPITVTSSIQTTFPLQHPKPPSSFQSDSGTYIHYYDSINDSALEMGNRRFREEEKRNTTSKLWKAISELGIVGDEDDEVYVDKIRAMEKRDYDGRMAQLAQKNQRSQ